MCIIAGEHRGRRIQAPAGQTTRPMLDRVREAMFSTLGDLVPDARVLDLFAGSGSLGLEALSRGARSARFVERDPRTLDTLRANVELLGLGDRARLVRDDAARLLAATGADERYDLVFLDPPYALGEGTAGQKRIAALVDELAARIDPPGLLVLHVERRAAVAGRWEGRGFDVRTYGGSALVYVPGRAAAGTGEGEPADAERERSPAEARAGEDPS
jgi:16S rRNA (guanine966-N2)-methyltransferase